jgi:predicted nucleic acid-binding Zn ribbon protein
MRSSIFQFTDLDGETYDVVGKTTEDALAYHKAAGWPAYRKLERTGPAHKCPGCGHERAYGYENARCWNCGW